MLFFDVISSKNSEMIWCLAPSIFYILDNLVVVFFGRKMLSCATRCLNNCSAGQLECGRAPSSQLGSELDFEENNENVGLFVPWHLTEIHVQRNVFWGLLGFSCQASSAVFYVVFFYFVNYGVLDAEEYSFDCGGFLRKSSSFFMVFQTA